MTTPTIDTTAKAPFYPGKQRFLGAVREISDDPLTLFTALMGRYPDIVRTRMGPLNTFIIFNADYAKHVLQGNHENYRRPRVFSRLLHAVAGHNLFSSEGTYWRRQRKVLSPAFHRQQIVGFGQIMVEETERLLGRWARQTGALDIQVEMTRLTLNIVGRSLFGVDMLADSRGQELTAGFAGTTAWLNYRFAHPFALPEWVPIRANRDFRRARTTVRRISQQILAERRAASTNGAGGDMLQMLIDLRYEDTGEGMTDEQIVNEMGTFFFAGHETTTNTLTWTFYLLSQNPDAEEKLHAELTSVLNGRAATSADLPQLPYTRMVIQEAMRLYPAAWVTSREPQADDQLGPYQIPAGANVFLAFYAIHRHPRYWQNPNAFDPERFTPQRSEGRPAHAYLPFGRGPRFCIGSQFALSEAQIALATIAQRYRLRLAPGAEAVPETVFTMRAKDALMMVLETRG